MPESPEGRQVVQDRNVIAELRAIGKDAREARDGMLRLTAVIGEQRYGERIEALHGNLEKCIEKVELRITMTESAMRQDFVHSIKLQDEKRDKAREEFHTIARAAAEERSKLTSRVVILEQRASKEDGERGIFKWVADHAAWFVALAASAFAGWAAKLGPHP